MNPSTKWTSHLDTKPDEKERFLTQLVNSTTVLRRLNDLLNAMEENLLNSELKVEDFDDTAWSHKQAFRNGKRSAYKELKDYLAFATRS